MCNVCCGEKRLAYCVEPGCKCDHRSGVVPSDIGAPRDGYETLPCWACSKEAAVEKAH